MAGILDKSLVFENQSEGNDKRYKVTVILGNQNHKEEYISVIHKFKEMFTGIIEAFYLGSTSSAINTQTEGAQH